MSTDCPKLAESSNQYLGFEEEGWMPLDLAHDSGNEMQARMMRTARTRMRGEFPAETRPPIWPDWAGRQPRPRCRIVLVDDHSVIREGVAALLTLDSSLEIAGCAGDVPSAIELVRITRPAVVVCDLNMPGISGSQGIQAIRKVASGAAILVLTGHNSLEYVRAAFISGAIGFVCKDAPGSELVRAVRRAACGRRTVSGTVRDAVFGDWLEHCPPPEAAVDADLDEEARQMLRYIALGVPTWRIARDQGCPVKVAERFRGKLMRRLSLKSSAAATRFAVAHGLVNSLELDHILEVRELRDAG